MSSERRSTWSRFATGVTFLGRVLLVAVFLTSGVAKLISPETATEFFTSIWQIDAAFVRIGVIGVSIAELVLAACLGLRPKMLTPPLVACCFFLASLVIGGINAGEDIDCGCFGGLIESRINETYQNPTSGPRLQRVSFLQRVAAFWC
jgi:uncharacterized membrane protein YphA (DoxX/SURF4 family)